MRFLSIQTLADEEQVHPTERELAEMSAFIEAQLRTGLVLPAGWIDTLEGKVPSCGGERPSLVDSGRSATSPTARTPPWRAPQAPAAAG